MKHLSIIIVALLSYLSANADIYQSMMFETGNGDITVVSAQDLEITFTDTDLVATNADESISLPLSELTSMMFTDREPTSVKEVLSYTGQVNVCTIAGVDCGSFASTHEALSELGDGIYIFTYDNGTSLKIAVSK